MLAALLCPASLVAQWGDSSWVRRTQIAPGVTVHVEVGHLVARAPQSQVTRPYVGRVTAIGHDTLFLATRDSSVAVPRILITGLEISLGRDRAYWAEQDAFIGALAGAYLGGIGQHGWRQRRADLFGGCGGFLLGYIIGASFPKERWVMGWMAP